MCKNAITINKLLGEKIDETGTKCYDITDYDIIVIDEIYLLNIKMLYKLYLFM